MQQTLGNIMMPAVTYKNNYEFISLTFCSAPRSGESYLQLLTITFSYRLLEYLSYPNTSVHILEVTHKAIMTNYKSFPTYTCTFSVNAWQINQCTHKHVNLVAVSTIKANVTEN